MPKIEVLDDKNFDEKVLKSKNPVMVDFYASWCGPCQMMDTTLDEVIKKQPDLEIYKVSVEKSQKLASKYNITSIPTLIYFKEGKPIDQQMGMVDEDKILEKFASLK